MPWSRTLVLALALGFTQVSPPAPTSAQVERTYVDDRSGPTEVLTSLVNAINRREYARAYSYWEADGPALPSFADFAAGYANTAAVELVTGAVLSDPGAGQLNYSVPVTIRSRLTDGTAQSFVGCYVLHMSQPGLQAPPFRPLGIRSAAVRQVPNDADHAALMNQACAAGGTQRPSPAAAPSSGASGPGQAVGRPAPLCAVAVGCQYLEHTPLSTDYRFQSLNVCGANCSAQYWVSTAASDQLVLEIGPVRGGAIVAFRGGAIVAERESDASGAHADLRVVQPRYAPADPGCCPSAFSDATYTWDAASASLVATQVSHIAAAEFAGWDATRQQLQADGWFLVNI